MAAVVLLGALIVASLTLACRRLGFRLGLLAAAAALSGGLVGALPGGVVFLFSVVVSASGTGPVPAWPAILCAAGSAGGAVAAVVLVNRRRAAARWSWAAWAALAGCIVGAGASFVGLLLAQDSGAESPLMLLSPLAVATATVAGFSLATRLDQRAT